MRTWTEARRRGVAATEFAVLLPLLMTLVLGGVDFGRFAYTAIAVADAARAGAGFGATHPYTTATFGSWQAQVRQAVVDDLGQLAGFDAAQLAVTATAPTQADGTATAQVDVCYPFTTLVAWPGVPAQVTLRQVVVLPAIAR